MPLYIVKQDITTMQCDAIVNTTNADMIGYSGVDADIHRVAGPGLDEECKKIVPLELGFAKVTKGYDLSCKYVIHTVGPSWRGGGHGERALLKSCYTECLDMAKETGCESVAFPLISSGAHGYPKDEVLSYAVELIGEFLKENEMTVYLCVPDKSTYEFDRGLREELDDFLEGGRRARTRVAYSCAMMPPDEDIEFCIRKSPKLESPKKRKPVESESLEEYLRQMDKSFIETLFFYIDRKGMTDAQCYKSANIDRKTFNKIKNNPNQKPSKQTAVALAIALELSFDETQHLLSTAGMTLSNTFVFDKIIRFFIKHKVYNIYQINEALFEYDQPLLGSM